jgi:hypothetical protein
LLYIANYIGIRCNAKKFQRQQIRLKSLLLSCYSIAAQLLRQAARHGH